MAQDGATGKPGRAIFVAPWGNDRNPGTRTRPLRSLLEARDAVRKLNGHVRANITVYLEGGTYRLAGPLELTARDSGGNGHDVIWTAVPGERAIISGAIRVRGWKLTDRAKNIWAASVPKTLSTRQIYVNGVRAQLASGPPPTTLIRQWTGYKAASSVMAHWRNPSDIEFVYTSQLGDNIQPICPVGSIDGEVITMAQPCWNNSNLRAANIVGFGVLGLPAYIENAYELLAQPGQFYLDRHAHVLYYIPRKGQDMRTADVEAPALTTLIEGKGTVARPIHNLQLDNLQLSYATWMQPDTPTGFSELQSGYMLTGAKGYATQGLCKLVPHGTCPYGAWPREPGNVQFSYDRDLTFSNDRFLHLGATALDLDDGSQDDTVVGSAFTDVSGNGIDIGNVDMPAARGGSQTIGDRILDNHIYGVPAEYVGGVDILVGYAADLLISHNQIDHTPYIPISMGWGGWLDKLQLPSVPNYSRDNVVSDNRIFDFMNVVADGGGVYTQGMTGSTMANGQKVTGNVIYGQLDWGSALKSDDGAAYVTYARNAMWDDIYDFGGVHYDYRPNPKTHQTCPLPTIRRRVVNVQRSTLSEDSALGVRRSVFRARHSAFSPHRRSNLQQASTFNGMQVRRADGHEMRRTQTVTCTYDPELVEDNLWQDGEGSYSKGGFVERGNRIVAGPQQAPVSILKAAGLQSRYRSLLVWRPAGAPVPAPPQHVTAIYAFQDKAYVTWHPSYIEGRSAVISYTVRGCASLEIDGTCGRRVGRAVTVPATAFDELGYVVVPGLGAGKNFTFSVTARNRQGVSAASIPSPPVTMNDRPPSLPASPQHVTVTTGNGIVSLSWYRPKNVGGVRDLLAPRRQSKQLPPTSSLYVLRYIVKASTGAVYDVNSHNDMISTNVGGRVLEVIPGLDPKRRYRFSIAAVTPAGTGRAATSPWIRPEA